MVFLFLILGCNLSCIVDLFAALHELTSASARTLLKLASSVCSLLKPYGDTLNETLKSAYKQHHITKTAFIHVHNDILCAIDNHRTAILLLLDTVDQSYSTCLTFK